MPRFRSFVDNPWTLRPAVGDPTRPFAVAQVGPRPAFIGHTWVMTAEQLALIATDPGVCHGQACVAGTRVMVSVILDCLAAGMTEDEIVAEYPSVTIAGVRAAAAYGASLAREDIIPLGEAG